VVVQVEEATGSAVVEGVPAVALHGGPCQVHQLELRVGIACSRTRCAHLSVFLRNIAELISHSQSGSINPTSTSANPPGLSVIDLTDHLVLIDAHLVQLLRLSDQDVLPGLVQVDLLCQVLVLSGSYCLALGQTSCASDASEAHNSIGSDKQLLLLILLRGTSTTRMRLSAAVDARLTLAGGHLPRCWTRCRGRLLRLRTIQVDQLLLECIYLLLRLSLEARVRPLLLHQAAVLLLQQDVVLLVLRKASMLGV